MRTATILLAALLAAPALPTVADTGESRAKEWNLLGEEKARFEAKVVDILCELSGDCPDDCGAGTRQLGLVTGDGKLIPVSKNGQAAFNGAIPDLLPFCNKAVEVDGLMVGEDMPAQIFQVQFIREQGVEEWTKTNRWTEDWKKRFPDATGKGPWFRRDPRVKRQIEQDGYLGLGHEVDREFIKEWY